MIYGYARVSTEDQAAALENQVDVLVNMGAAPDRVVTEVGSTRKPLPLRDELIERLEAKDELVVFKLDRIGRSRKDVFEVFERLDAKDVSLRTHDGLLIDPTTAVGRLVRDLLVAISQFERDNAKERQLEGVKRAKRQGKYRGRSPALRHVSNAMLKSMVDAHGVQAAANEFGCHRTTVKRELKRRGLE